MPQLVSFGVEVALIVRISLGSNGNLIDDLETVALETDHLFGIVGEQPNLPDAEIVEDLSPHPVVAQVGGEAQFLVGFHGIEALFLEFVGVDLGGESDSAAFLTQVEQDAAVLGDAFQGGVELAPTIAAARAEDVAGEALRVHPDEHWFVGIDLAPGESEMMGAIGMDAIEVAIEIAVVGGELDRFFTLDEAFGSAAVFDDLSDGTGLQTVFFLVVAQIADPSHGAVFVHDLAEDSSWAEPGHPGEIDRRFGVSRAPKDTIVCSLQRKDMPGLHERIRPGGLVGEEADGKGAIGGGDPSGDSFRGIDCDGEGGAVTLAIAPGHGGKVEGFYAGASDRGANQAPPVSGHEGDHLGGGPGGCANEVRFVFAAGIVRDDDKFSSCDLGDDLFDGSEGKCSQCGR